MQTTISFTQAFNEKHYQKGYVLEHLKKFNKGVEADWADFTKLFMSKFVDYLLNLDSVCQNSARLYCSLIKTVINLYSDEIKPQTKEYSSILSVKKTGVLKTYLTPAEIQLLIDYVPKDKIEHTVRNQFVSSCLTGMRTSEVVMLRESNIRNNEVSYYAPKNRGVVRVPSSEVVNHYVREQMNTKYSNQTINKYIRCICKAVGMTEPITVVKGGKPLTDAKYKFITSHSARCSFATNTYNILLNILQVSKLMGHSDIEVTQGYLCCDTINNDQLILHHSQYTLPNSNKLNFI